MERPLVDVTHAAVVLGKARPEAVTTIPPGRAFLDCLAGAILAGNLPRPGGAPPRLIDLPRITILLPTRRSARALQEAFLKRGGGKAMLLPRIRPIAEADETATLLSGIVSLGTLGVAADLPPAISEIERRLVLTELVMRWSAAMRAHEDDIAPVTAAGAGTPAQAAALARDLAALMDTVETENVRLDRLAEQVPEGFSAHWQKTMTFLEIALAMWPRHLAERGMLSPADRRNRVILDEAQRLSASPPAGPVIVAGVTGGIPAAAELMRTIATLDEGAIVLPGLDQGMDDASWSAVLGEHPEHPQHGLAALLGALGIGRHAVTVLSGAAPSPAAAARARVVGEAMRPASTTEAWRSYIDDESPDVVRSAFAGVSRIDAPSAPDEAEAVALILREAAERTKVTAALVTPDRLLARRVAVRLESWGIRVDDSAGRPFAKTVPGAFLDLLIEAVRTELAPAPLMALLKHPLTRLGLSAFDVRKAARTLEIAAFRATYLGRGLGGVRAALERAETDRLEGRRQNRAAERLWEKDLALAHDLVRRLERALEPLAGHFASQARCSLRSLATAHVAAAEALSRMPDAGTPPTLWDGEAGTAAATFFAGLLDPALPSLEISAVDYPDLYRNLVAGESVRARIPAHPRLFIWGPLEARLQQPDIIVLGSLNEGTWPEAADPGPWLNRPMRSALGLPQPETRIGHAAHDVTQLLGAERVYLTRALKVDGVPTVASRWLLRLDALLSGLGVADVLTPDRPWLGWTRGRDAISRHRRIPEPRPCPALGLRPRRLSVSDIERWIASPYELYAKRILGLEPLALLGAEPDASLRGSLLHAVLGRFATAYPEALPADPHRELMRLAATVLGDFAAHPRVAAFWMPRLDRFARWFAATEAARRTGIARTHAEVDGREVIDAPGGPFTLTARADRIDAGEGGIVITDYKTGAGLGLLASRALKGEAPQLPLEASIAVAGGFAQIAPRTVTALRYISVSGGEPPGDEVTLKVADAAALATTARGRLAVLVAAFDDPRTPYRAVRRSRFDYDHDDYAHLARIAEWSAEGAEPGGEE